MSKRQLQGRTIHAAPRAIKLPDRAALTCEDVAGWFCEAFCLGEKPSPQHVAALTHALNLGAPAMEPRKRQPPKDIQRLTSALREILTVAPLLVKTFAADARQLRVDGNWTDVAESTERTVKRLRYLIYTAEQTTHSFPIPPPGKRRAYWHPTALFLAKLIAAALRQSGRTRISFRKPDGPAVKVLVRAMAHIEGFQRHPDAVAEVVRDLR